MEIKDGAHTATVPDTTPTMTHDEWLEEGRRRFGNGYDVWRFVCPICGNVASVGDFKQFKDRGATPDSATQECIGRYDGSAFKAFGTSAESGKPCDYALYGLFRLPGVIVISSDGKRLMSFAFDKSTL